MPGYEYSGVGRRCGAIQRRASYTSARVGIFQSIDVDGISGRYRWGRTRHRLLEPEQLEQLAQPARRVAEPDRATEAPGGELEARHRIDIARARTREAGDIARDALEVGGHQDVVQPAAQRANVIG